jgi:hypothetical protein
MGHLLYIEPNEVMTKLKEYTLFFIENIMHIFNSAPSIGFYWEICWLCIRNGG